jgi:integrase
MEGTLAEAGITKNARLHDACHTCGTLLGEQHVDMHVIQRILGHAQVSTTRIYTDPTDPLTREAVDRLGSMLWPQPEPNRNRKRNQRPRAKRSTRGKRK